VGRHVHNGRHGIEGPSSRFGTDSLKHFFRTQFLHSERERKDLGNRLDGEGIIHVTQSQYLVIRGDNGDAKQLRVHLGEVGNVVGVLAGRITLEFFVSLANNGLYLFSPGGTGLRWVCAYSETGRKLDAMRVMARRVLRCSRFI
jgi:hypothetical protein